MNRVSSSASELRELVARVQSGCQEQVQGFNRITTALSHVQRASEASASGAEQSAAAAEQLNSHADRLQDVLEDLGTLVWAESHGQPEPAR
jgi:methyl-accepting chemotaxis protein